MDGTKKMGLTCIPFKDDTFDEETAGNRISACVTTVVVLTDRCLERKDILYALQAASFYYQPRASRALLVRQT